MRVTQQQQHTPEVVVLNAKKKRRSTSSNNGGGSLLEPFINLVSPSSSSNNSPVESTFETAIMLVDKKRTDEFKKDMQKQFPFVPSSVIDICVDSLADSFKAVAPAKLQQALKPGGFEKVRPDIEDTIVGNLQTQSMIQDLPLSKSDKIKILKYIVNMALDIIFKDVQELLKDPTQRLQVLDEKRYQIQRYMSQRQLLCYRLKNYPIQIMLLTITTILSCLYLHRLILNKTAVIPTVTAAYGSAVTAMQSPWNTIKAFAKSAKGTLQDYLSLLGIGAKATRRRFIRY